MAERVCCIAYAGGTASHVTVRESSYSGASTLMRAGGTLTQVALVGSHFEVELPDGTLFERFLVEEGEGRQRHNIIIPPPEALPTDAGDRLQPGTVAWMRGVRSAPQLNNTEALLLWRQLGRDGAERWAVSALHSERQVLVRPANLVLLRQHAASHEATLAADARALFGAAEAAEAHTGGALGFGAARELPADLAIMHVLSRLTRLTLTLADGADQSDDRHRQPSIISAGELAAASAVCRQWHGACLATRATLPACAADVAARLRLAHGDAALTSGELVDGEHTLYHHGESSRPMRLFCHNLLSRRPTEFLTLLAGPAHNFAYVPAGGTIGPLDSSAHTHAATRFGTLRASARSPFHSPFHSSFQRALPQPLLYHPFHTTP